MPRERPLAERQRKVLLILLAAEERGQWAMTANAIGYRVGAPRSRRVRGPWSGLQAPSQQVVPAIVGLRKRGLVTFGSRPGGLSGTADRLTDAGRAKARELRAEGTDG